MLLKEIDKFVDELTNYFSSFEYLDVRDTRYILIQAL